MKWLKRAIFFIVYEDDLKNLQEVLQTIALNSDINQHFSPGSVTRMRELVVRLESSFENPGTARYEA